MAKKPLRVSAAALARDQLALERQAHPPSRWLREVLPNLLIAFGAFGYQLGGKNRRGRWLREPAITFFTDHKRNPSPGGGDVQRVPPWLTWKDGKHLWKIKTDVLEVTPEIELQAGAVFGPGDGATIGGEVASIGAAVLRPGDGQYITTAGHLFGHGQAGTRVSVASGATTAIATVAESVVRTTVDYALLRLSDGSRCDNLFREHLRIGPVFTPTRLDVGVPLLVLDRFGRATRTRCRGVNATIASGSGTYRGLVTADCVTEGGQSGGALIDDSNRLWGFLIGALGGRLSLFTPAQTVFDHAGVVLIS